MNNDYVTGLLTQQRHAGYQREVDRDALGALAMSKDAPRPAPSIRRLWRRMFQRRRSQRVTPSTSATPAKADTPI